MLTVGRAALGAAFLALAACAEQAPYRYQDPYLADDTRYGDYQSDDGYEDLPSPGYLRWPAYYSVLWPTYHAYYDPWYSPDFYYGVTYFPSTWFGLGYDSAYAWSGYTPFSPYP